MKIAFLFIGMCISYSVCGQANTTSNGAEISGSGGSVSQSIGQVFYSTSNGAIVTITQGVQQTYINVEETALIDEGEKTLIKVYPNPSSDIVILELVDFNKRQYHVSLTDLNGKILSENTIQAFKTSLDLKSYVNSSYNLTIYLNNERIKVFTLIKSQ